MSTINTQPLRQQTPDRNLSFAQDFFRTALNQISNRLNSVYSFSNTTNSNPSITGQSVLCNTPNGHGSTATKIRRFTNSSTIGDGITYADSAVNGASFTISTPGIYAISWSDSKTGANFDIGISLNSTELSTSITSITTATRLQMAGQSSGIYAFVMAIAVLNTNDVIRAHDDGTPSSTSNDAQFRIVRIS